MLSPNDFRVSQIIRWRHGALFHEVPSYFPVLPSRSLSDGNKNGAEKSIKQLWKVLVIPWPVTKSGEIRCSRNVRCVSSGLLPYYTLLYCIKLVKKFSIFFFVPPAEVTSDDSYSPRSDAEFRAAEDLPAENEFSSNGQTFVVRHILSNNLYFYVNVEFGRVEE